MIPGKDEAGGFKPGQAHQVMLGVTLLIVRQSRWLGQAWQLGLARERRRGAGHVVLHARKPLGYDASAVDDLLARVASERTPLGQQARWSRTRRGRGYDIDPDAARPADSDAAGTSGARCSSRAGRPRGRPAAYPCRGRWDTAGLLLRRANQRCRGRTCTHRTAPPLTAREGPPNRTAVIVVGNSSWPAILRAYWRGSGADPGTGPGFPV